MADLQIWFTVTNFSGAGPTKIHLTSEKVELLVSGSGNFEAIKAICLVGSPFRSLGILLFLVGPMGVVSTHVWQVVHRWRFVDFILSPSTAFPFVMVPGQGGSKWFEGDGWPQLTFFCLDFNLFFSMFLLGLYDIGMFFSVNKKVPLWNSLKPLDLSRIRMGGFLRTPFAWRITPCTLPFGMFTKQSCWCIRDGSGQGISWPKLPVPSLTWNRVNLRIWRETELEKWPEFGLVKYYSLPRCVTDDTHDDLTKVFNLIIFKCFAKCLSISVGRLDWRCDSVRWDILEVFCWVLWRWTPHYPLKKWS